MAPDTTRLRVLLAEDSRRDARLVAEHLREVPEERRPQLHHVSTLAAALDELDRVTYDCVLLDLGLPDGGGIANVDRVRAAHPQVAIVVMTGLNDERVAVAALRQGAQEYLVKGRYDDNALPRVIQHAVERHRLLAELDRRLVQEGFLASHDLLTRLPNRQQFNERASAALERAERSGQTVAICYLDLDGFKHVNDTWGHAIGDAVLREVSRVLGRAVRDGDLVARVGGDEFALLLFPAGAADAAHVAARIARSIADLTEVEGRPIAIGASVGVALLPEHGTTLEALLAHADHAMYAAKRTARPAHPASADGRNPG